MFARDSYLDDDDYAYKKQRKAQIESRKLTALSYDTSARVSNFLQSSLQPILQERGRAAIPSLSRMT